MLKYITQDINHKINTSICFVLPTHQLFRKSIADTTFQNAVTFMFDKRNIYFDASGVV